MTDWSLSHRALDMGRSDTLRSACAGTYRVIDQERAGPALAECDGCGDVLGVARELLSAVPAPTRSDEGWLR